MATPSSNPSIGHQSFGPVGATEPIAQHRGDSPPPEAPDKQSQEELKALKDDLTALREWEQATSALASLRQRALHKVPSEDVLARIYNVQSIRKAVSVFKKRTSTGADTLPIHTLSSLPDEALHELALLMRDMRRQVALPVQKLVVLLSTIPKKLGGLEV